MTQNPHILEKRKFEIIYIVWLQIFSHVWIFCVELSWEVRGVYNHEDKRFQMLVVPTRVHNEEIPDVYIPRDDRFFNQFLAASDLQRTSQLHWIHVTLLRDSESYTLMTENMVFSSSGIPMNTSTDVRAELLALCKKMRWGREQLFIILSSFPNVAQSLGKRSKCPHAGARRIHHLYSECVNLIEPTYHMNSSCRCASCKLDVFGPRSRISHVHWNMQEVGRCDRVPIRFGLEIRRYEDITVSDKELPQCVSVAHYRENTSDEDECMNWAKQNVVLCLTWQTLCTWFKIKKIILHKVEHIQAMSLLFCHVRYLEKSRM